MDAQPLSFGEEAFSQPLPSSASHPNFGVYDASVLMPLDPGLAFLDDQRNDGTAGIDFLDMLPQDYATATTTPHHQHHHQHQHHPHHPQTTSPPGLSSSDSLAHASPSYSLDLSGVDLLGGIGFEQQPNAASAPRSAATRVMHTSFDRYMVKNWDQNLSDASIGGSTATPSAHSTSTSSVSSHTSLRPNPNITCGCLSSLYLTLDCLGNLPADIPASIRSVRNAVRVAHATIRCDLCSGPEIVNTPSQPVPIQAFQNLMLLAALVPSACNAYATILERVDIEADRARNDGEALWFSFRDFGGASWEAQAESGKSCMLMQGFNDKKMPPDMWRAAVREIIRADVDGGEANSYGDPQQQRGLRDVVRALEDRSHKRHEQMDHAAVMGTLPKHGVLLHPRQHDYQPLPPQDRHCMRVLDAARMALNNLVIA